MDIPGKLVERIVEALLSAFDRASLTALVRFALDTRLSVVAGGQNDGELFFNLVQWAESQGKLLALLQAAQVERPDHPELHAVVRALEAELHTTPVVVHLCGVPPRNPFFVGRLEVLQAIRERFKQQHVYVLSGLGGVGKTQIAVEYVHRFGQSDFERVFWIRGDSEASLIAGFAGIAYSLSLARPSDTHQGNAVQAARNWLSANAGWLLVLDNAESPRLVKAYLPQAAAGRVLITTRSIQTSSLGVPRPQRLEPFTRREAVEFLEVRTDRPIRSALSPERQASEDLAAHLGYLPLALEQAASYLTAKEATFTAYLGSFKRRSVSLLEQQAPETGDYGASVATTWSLNFSEVENTPASAEILRLTAFLHPDAVPLELLTEGASELGPVLETTLASLADDPLILDEVLEPLSRYSLIGRDLPERTYRTHRLVQQVLYDRLSDAERQLWARRAVQALGKCFPDSDYDVWHLCERLISHAQLAAEWVRKWDIHSLEAASLIGRFGEYLRQRGRYTEASEALPYAFELTERLAGPEDLRTAEMAARLALLRQQQGGEYREAEALYLRAISCVQKHAPADRLRLSAMHCGLGSLLQLQGRFDEAEGELSLAVELLRQADECTGTRMGAALNALATLYLKQEQFSKAEELLRRVLRLQRETLPPNHPDIARTLNNLGGLFAVVGNHPEAEAAYLESLEVREKTLGGEHPDTAVSMGNLGLIYARQGRYSEALPLLTRVLEIRDRTLGPAHPRTADVLENLATLYQEMDRYADAEPLFARAVHIRSQADPPDPSALQKVELELARVRTVLGRQTSAPDGSRQT